MTVHILYRNYMNSIGTEMSIGGIQTYLRNLAKILRAEGNDVVIYQIAERDFTARVDDVEVCGFACTKKNEPKFLLGKCLARANRDEDIILFGCETFAVPAPGYKTVAIQHGIFWDKPWHKYDGALFYFAYFLHKARKAWATIKRVSSVSSLICVDYNFPNWYRATVAHQNVDLQVIPNFTQIPEDNTVKHEGAQVLKMIFARRFCDYRGTRIFADAAERILEKYPNVEITFAGDGEDEAFLKEKFNSNSQVRFTRYESHESLAVHADQHIAVVPTIGSEGTSLSLLEAMASSCAVVCSNVGGMTNVVIDHYNGLMVSPDKDSLHDALVSLIEHEELRTYLAKNAHRTVKEGFSYELWKSRWLETIKKT